MTRLVYGVLRGEGTAGPLPPGLGGRPVELIAAAGLSAAVTEAPPLTLPSPPRGGEGRVRGLAPAVELALAYARIVEALHRQRAVLPMRFGCLLSGDGAVRELLCVRREAFLTALDEVDGCDEMGLRVLPSDPAPEAPSPAPVCSGAAYLAARRARYAAEDARRTRVAGAADRLRSAFAGLYRRCQAEQAVSAAGPLVSLSFLVPRSDREAFRAAFRRLQREEPARLLLTGPWPPYNFAALDRAGVLP